MSVTRQIVLSLIVVLVAVGGWYAYDRGYLFGHAGGGAEVAQVGGSPGGGAGRGPGGGAGGGGRGGGAGRGALVIAAQVTTDDTGMDVRAIGTVASARAITIYPQVTGIVVEAPLEPGTKVEAGQVLVRLDDKDQQVAVDKARIARDAAKTANDRAESLAKSNNITTVALEDTRTALQKAEIDLAAAENDLAKRTITAPFAGTIGLTDVTVGDLVSSSKAITTLDDTSEVTVTFVVPERASGQVTLGQPVTATTEALAGQSFTGEISAIDSRVDASARTLAVEATLPNDANVLKPGMALVVNLSFAGVAHPQVPSLAVQWDREGPYVWKVTDGKVHRVGVQILGRRSGTAIVAGDLAMGEQVVVEGLQRVREGAAVTVEGAGAPSDGQAPSATGGGDGGPQAVQRPSVGPGPEGGARGGAQRPSRG